MSVSPPVASGGDLDPTQPTAEERAALRHLAKVALGSSGQANRCANFLLAWSDADTWGAFDLTDLWACNPRVIQDMVSVFGLIARVAEYPEVLEPALRADLKAIAARWRQ